MELIWRELLILCQYQVKLGWHRHYDSADIMSLIYHVIWQDYERSYDLMGRRPST